ncbi:structural maintenance of chromosomes protein 1 [Dorcoceras hygrometricum]|uniref:Structural maintenance of chromosomes protein 1 n=1 Tax=Dorcoceras hygrometricum TaxID=472368 RepID=A0A2Z7BQ69_9LAMI|nr:structural maintenance of chromosomes protein 1 [Dorcoceras hygrometricum]
METTESAAVEMESRIDVSSITNYDEEEPLVETEREEEKEIELVTAEEMSLEKITDSEDTEPLSKVLALTVKSTSSEEYIEFLVQIREQVIEEIVSFFSSFSLRRLAILGPLSDIAAKEEKILVWAETDSLQTAVSRRLYIVAKYREMLLRKFFEARNKNFVSGTPTTTIDLQILEMLSDAHQVALEKFLEQMREHTLEWTRPINSRLFEGAHKDCEGPDMWVRQRRAPFSHKWDLLPKRIFLNTIARICIFFEPVQVVRSLPIVKTWGWARVCTDIIHFHLFGHLEPVGTRNFCTDIVPVGPVVDNSGVTKRSVNNVQYDIRIVDCISIISSDTVAAEPVVYTETTPTEFQRHPDANSDSSTSIPIDFVNEETADAQTSLPTIVSSIDVTDARNLLGAWSVEHELLDARSGYVRTELYAGLKTMKSPELS